MYENSFATLPYLEHLGLNDNLISKVHPYFTDNLPKLKSLSLQHNNFTMIGNDMFNRTPLSEKLDLCGTFISLINDRAFSKMIRLKDLTMNKFSFLSSDVFSLLHDESYLDLIGNNFFLHFAILWSCYHYIWMKTM